MREHGALGMDHIFLVLPVFGLEAPIADDASS